MLISWTTENKEMKKDNAEKKCKTSPTWKSSVIGCPNPVPSFCREVRSGSNSSDIPILSQVYLLIKSYKSLLFCSCPKTSIDHHKNPDLHPDSPTMPAGAPAAGHGQDTHLEAQARNTSEVDVIPEAC